MTMHHSPRAAVAILCLALLLGGCVCLTGCVTGPQGAIFETGSALETRSQQTRVLDTSDSNAAMRAVISTLQDLGFVIDRADAALGSVSATKLARYQVRMTVTVRSRDAGGLLVRANADYSEPASGKTALPIDDPVAYQDFFQALERSAFLATQRAE
jgi:hypothetical protein